MISLEGISFPVLECHVNRSVRWGCKGLEMKMLLLTMSRAAIFPSSLDSVTAVKLGAQGWISGLCNGSAELLGQRLL